MHKQNRRATDAGGRETARNLGNGLTTTRSYLADNQIQSIATPTVETLTYMYDTKGNMTTDDRGCGMTWDFDNMLQSFAANGVTDLKNATYEYDATGRRVAKNVAESGGTQTTVFVQAGQQVTCEYTPGNATTDCDRKYAYGSYIDEVLNYVDATPATEVRYWLQQNRQYSVYSVFLSTGIVSEFYRYDSFGRLLNIAPLGIEQGTSPLCGIRHTFTGQSHDSESQVLCLRSRYYSPFGGRFLHRDPLGTVDGANLYAGYFAPQYVDPTGMTCAKICDNAARRVDEEALQQDWNDLNNELTDGGKNPGRGCTFASRCCPENLNNTIAKLRMEKNDYAADLYEKGCRICENSTVQGNTVVPVNEADNKYWGFICNGAADQKQTLKHEFRHAMDLCKWGIHERNQWSPEQKLCSELNAYAYDETCEGDQYRLEKETKEDCLIRHAVGSMVNAGSTMTEEELKKIAKRLLKDGLSGKPCGDGKSGNGKPAKSE